MSIYTFYTALHVCNQMLITGMIDQADYDTQWALLHAML